MGAPRIANTARPPGSGFRTGTVGLIGHVLALACAAVFLGSTPAFASERVIADFDGDGIGDHAVLSRHEPTIVRVWLSLTRRVDIIRSREPILHIAAADLDGDTRQDLVARVPTALRAWVRRSGRFHAYHPHQRSVTRRLSRSRNHASNADPLCAEPGGAEGWLIAPSLDSTLLVVPPPRVAWTDASNPVRGPTSRAPVYPFTPRPPPFAL